MPTPATTAPERALTRGARLLTAGTLTIGALNYAYALLLTRLLPTREYAGFAAGQALLLTAGTIAAVSVPWVLAQELARASGDRTQRSRAVWFATITNVVQGALVGLAAGLVSATFADWATSSAVGVSAALIFAASTSLGWFQGDQRFGAIAVRGVAEVLGKIAFGLALVALGAGGGGALGGFGVGALLIAAAGTWCMRADYRKVTGALSSPELWRSARGVAGIQGLVSVLASVDVVLVAVLPVASGAAASYQASMILARVPLFLAGAVAAVAFPMLGTAGASAAGLLRSSSRLYLVISLPLALVLATAPHGLLVPLFPHSYDRVGALLPFTAAAGILIGFIELLTTFFQAAGHYAACMRRQLVGVVFSLLAVPIGFALHGATGIAVAACAGAALTVLLLLVQAARVWPGSSRPALGAALLPAGLGVALLALRQEPALWLAVSTLVLGGCGYTVFLRPGARVAP